MAAAVDLRPWCQSTTDRFRDALCYLPPASPPPPGEELKEPVFISIQDDTSLYVVDEQTTLENLIPAVNAALAVPNPREERIFVRANPDVMYERFMEVMNTLQANGYYKVGLLNEDIE